MFAVLVRCLAVGVEFVYTQIAGVGQKFEAGGQREATVFEQSKIMSFAGTGLHTKNQLSTLVNHDLSFQSVAFQSVAFLLAGVEAALFFSGRSMRCSLASTTITVRSKEPLCNAFLPGR